MKARGKRVWIVIGYGVYPVREKTNSKVKTFKTKELAKAYVEKKRKGKVIEKKKKKVIKKKKRKGD